MSSIPDAFDISGTFNKYIADPAKQLNLGWTVIPYFYVAAFFIGLLLIAIMAIVLATNQDYRQGNKSKRGLVILGWIGFALVLFALWTTIGSFYKLVGRINTNVKVRGKCSFFQDDTASNTAKRIVADSVLSEGLRNHVAAESTRVLRKTAGNTIDLAFDGPTSSSAAIYSED